MTEPAAGAPLCSAPEDCDRPARARGWCEMHYHRWLRTGTLRARVSGPEPAPVAPQLTRAACAGMDPEIFFDDDTVDAAVAICNTCSIRAQCLDWALSYGPSKDADGVFGGLTAGQRDARRKAHL